MITDKLINTVKEFVYGEENKYGVPSRFQTDFANNQGQLLAQKLKVDGKLVLLGTLLMDCMLGKAYKEGKLKDHVEMSIAKANELLSNNVDLTNAEKENIIHCVKEHHGTDRFFSLESEICCNADCYKFASVKGVIIAMQYTSDMPTEDLIRLILNKADEKWNTLSLDICRNELEPQYKLIMEFFNKY